MVYDKKTERLGDYLDRGIDLLKSKAGFLGRSALKFVNLRKLILKRTARSEEAQFNVEFTQKNDVRDRCLKFYLSSLFEIEEMKKDKTPFDIPLPQKVIFGHTHIPIRWNSMEKPNDRPLTAPNGQPIFLFNCGGWLVENDEKGRDEFRGAEVFLYETGKGMTSVSVKQI
jgi:hypothetical protein